MFTLYDANKTAMKGVAPYIVMSAKTDQLMKSRVPEEARPSRLQLSRLAAQLKTTDEIEHSFNLVKDPGDGWFIDDWIELARIPSYNGKITTLRRIDTFVGSTSQVNVDQPQSETFLYNWIEWRLIYTSIRGGPRRIFNQLYPGFGNLPGVPFFRLPFWQDNRYAWGRTDNRTTFPLAPGYNLSLFARIKPLTVFPPDWDAQGTYKKGDIVFRLAPNSLFMAMVQNINAPPNTNPDLWELIANIPLASFFYSLAGRLTASVQDEQAVTSAYQARTTFR
jgi:hypothetical protein